MLEVCAGQGLKPAFLGVDPNFIFLALIKDDLFGGGGALCLGKATAAVALRAQSRVRVEKGHPKTASLPPTMPVTDNTLLSGMGGQWSHRRAGGGQGRRALDKGLHSARPPPPPPLPWTPPKVVVFVPAPGLGGSGHLRPGSSSAHPLLCVSSTSLSHLFSCLLKPTGDNQ